MKRLLIYILLTAVLGAGSPLPTAWNPETNTEWGFTASAKNKRATPKKSTKKNKSGKATKKNKKTGTGLLKSGKKKSTATTGATAAMAAMPRIGNEGKAANSLLWVSVPRSMANQTVNYKAMTVFFNNKLRIPNCVSYELTNTLVAMADAPTAEKRKNYHFNTDSRVTGSPDGNDYRNSGYTRGHMAPAMDMRWDKQAMSECFMMTNMCPQEQKLNNDDWRKLEERIHRWAKRDGRLIIFTGPVMGLHPQHIGPKNDIAVPDAFYKIVYAPQQQRAIAFVYANKPCPGSWRNYAVSIDEVERRTGIDFLPSLPNSLQQSLERMNDPTVWE